MLRILFLLSLLVGLSEPLAAQFGTIQRHKKISEVSGFWPGGLDPNDQLGRAVVSPGDIDGDGNADLVSGAIGDDDGGTQGETSDTGAVWVHFMKPTGGLRENAKISMTMGGLQAQLDTRDQFGRSLADLGDFDGDGVPDIAVGACRDDDGGINRGAIYLLFLNRDGTVKDERKISDTEGNFLGELEDLDEFGRAIANLGDLDGNGVIDLAVGATGDDDGGVDLKGAVWILFMNADGTVLSHQKISDTQGNFKGIITGEDIFGFSIANLGDLDGDGVIDLAVGTPKDHDGGVRKGAVWILFMNANGTVKGERKISDVGGVYGLQDGCEFGSALAGIGDLDGDGVPDMAVGAILDEGAGHDRGAVFVNFMNPDGTVKSKVKVNDVVGNFQGNLADGDWFGAALAWMADLDGNGIGEIVVGARFDDDGGISTGSLWVLFPNGVPNVRPTPGFVMELDGGVVPLQVQFEDRSSAGAQTWDWDFGDGATSTQPDPTHTYTDPGSYTVSLTVSGPGGSKTLTLPDAVFAGIEAQAVMRNGSGTNVVCYQTTSLPVLGGTWTSEVDASHHPGAGIVVLLGCVEPSSGTFLPGGELLVRTAALGGQRIFRYFKGSQGATAHFSTPVPNSLVLMGLSAASQALIRGGGQVELSNAVDLVIGF